jgi:hypothetical protein
MLGGTAITTKTLEHAEEMINLGRAASQRTIPSAADGNLALLWNHSTAVS